MLETIWKINWSYYEVSCTFLIKCRCTYRTSVGVSSEAEATEEVALEACVAGGKVNFRRKTVTRDAAVCVEAQTNTTANTRAFDLKKRIKHVNCHLIGGQSF